MLNLERATAWTVAYIDDFLKREFQTAPRESCGVVLKSVGEFVLFSDILLNRISEPVFSCAKYADIVRATCERLVERLEWFQYLQNREIEYFEIVYFLGRALKTDLIPLSHIQEHAAICSNQRISLEHAFFMECLGLTIPQIYWQLATLELLQVIGLEGFSLKWMYQMTHLVFFASDFGRSSLMIDPHLSKIIRDLLKEALKLTMNSQNWDLTAELAISLLFLDYVDIDKDYSLIDSACLTVFSQQSISGWVLSDGELLPNGWINNLNLHDSKTRYSLFHTTIVSILLFVFYANLRHNKKQAT